MNKIGKNKRVIGVNYSTVGFSLRVSVDIGRPGNYACGGSVIGLITLSE